MIKLLIVEDQQMTLEMLTTELAKVEDFELVGSITTADLALKACLKLKPEIVLMDILTKSNINGIEATKQIKATLPDIKVILFTGFDEFRYPELAKEAGAEAYLSKNLSLTELVDKIHLVAEGRRIYPKKAPEIKLGETNAPITSRELAILASLCEGKKRKDIAEELNISINTVNFHINNMLLKTGSDNILSLAVNIAAKGYIIPNHDR